MATLYDADGNEVEVPDEALQLDGQQGPAGLRKHARQLEADLKAEQAARATEAAKLTQYERRDAFEAALKEAGVDGLSLADLGEIPPEQITPVALKVKAAEKEEAKRQQFATQAAAMGMTPEQYEAAVKEIAAKNEADKQALAAQTAIAAGGQAPPVAKPKPGEKGLETWKQAKETGTPDDYAQAAFVRGVAEATISP